MGCQPERGGSGWLFFPSHQLIVVRGQLRCGLGEPVTKRCAASGSESNRLTSLLVKEEVDSRRSSGPGTALLGAFSGLSDSFWAFSAERL